jgi:hypothetical protein
MNPGKPTQIKAMKGRQGIAALTVYDFGMARILKCIGVPLQDEQKKSESAVDKSAELLIILSGGNYVRFWGRFGAG